MGISNRGHSLKLQKKGSKKARSDGNFFGLKVVHFWNFLTKEIVSAPNTNSFKKGSIGTVHTFATNSHLSVQSINQSVHLSAPLK
jgi:hypothetical protein